MNRNSSKCADVEGWSKDDGGNVHQWSCRLDDDSNQKWTFRRTADRYWNVVNQNSGRCLDIQGPSYADGAHLHQWICRNQDNNSQQWRFFTATWGGSRGTVPGRCQTPARRSGHDDHHRHSCRFRPHHP
ncbi:RICIN domain-containing protein [Streptomyces sp. NBC_01006]|uniref:RICIN domain-containing protein n=1 Tax=Streptomyces sp. NBC_01006 TaxID=2903716 RepID=UPI00386C1B98|nr:RICIN domain-containing protein [Streptomyces sp. NBC_01006]